MAHLFDQSDNDPYVAAEHAVEEYMFSRSVAAGAEEQIYDTLGNAIVSALGDIAAAAFRNGVNQPQQLKGLAQAVAHVSQTVIASYRGEVDPEPVFQAIEHDPRLETLSPESKLRLTRQLEKARQTEHAIISGVRLPDILDLAGSLDLHVPEDALNGATVLVPGDNMPGPGVTRTE